MFNQFNPSILLAILDSTHKERGKFIYQFLGGVIVMEDGKFLWEESKLTPQLRDCFIKGCICMDATPDEYLI